MTGNNQILSKRYGTEVSDLLGLFWKNILSDQNRLQLRRLSLGLIHTHVIITGIYASNQIRVGFHNENNSHSDNWYEFISCYCFTNNRPVQGTLTVSQQCHNRRRRLEWFAESSDENSFGISDFLSEVFTGTMAEIWLTSNVRRNLSFPIFSRLGTFKAKSDEREGWER